MKLLLVEDDHHASVSIAKADPNPKGPPCPPQLKSLPCSLALA